MLLRRLLPLCLLLAACTVSAGRPPYDEAADAHADVQHALAAAQREHKAVLLIFGANWCPDCRVLEGAISSGDSNSLLQRNFEIVKINVGQFDHNTDLDAQYGDPIHNGIPAAALLSPEGRLLYTTSHGELADARHMSSDDIYHFFQRLVAQAG